jgi:hypothetical protein
MSTHPPGPATEAMSNVLVEVPAGIDTELGTVAIGVAGSAGGLGVVTLDRGGIAGDLGSISGLQAAISFMKVTLGAG